MIRVPYNHVVDLLTEILIPQGFTPDRAAASARLFADANRDGVISHGLDRFGSYLKAVSEGLINPGAEPVRVWSGGALERWDGRSGPGNLNAWTAMNRALELAEENGVGCVALSHTNHWMRGGNFGWQAVEAGRIGLCFTNTMPNMPPWGSAHRLIGNNPLVIAVPRKSGPVVLDMAMSQFSYGALSRYGKDGRKLPVPGGYDEEGQMSDNPVRIEKTGRLIPAGFWKGSGLSIVLDLLAALLSGGKAVSEISSAPGRETDVSQVFMAFAPPEFPGLADRVVDSLKVPGEADVRYPGESALRYRAESMKSGLPVDQDVWENIQRLSRNT